MPKKLYCFKCGEEHNINDFTPFDRNPNLKDRWGRVIWCRKSCSEFVNERSNSLDALREILRIVDIPYLDKVANTALKIYKQKLKKTNIVTKKNLHSGEEEVSKETITLQTTIYSCYTSKMIMIPKQFSNFSYSDGIRVLNEVEPSNVIVIDDKREIRTAETKIKNKFGEDLYNNDKGKLSKIIQLHFDTLSLKAGGNSRQEKFKLKNALLTLIENEKLDKKDYGWLFGDSKEDNEEKIYSSEWKGMYTPIDLKYLDDYINGLKRDFKIITINHLDYARKIAKSSLHMDKCFDEMLNGVVGAEKKYKEARETFDTLSKSAQFSENSRGQNDVSLGCFGKVFEKVENHNWIPEWESLKKDDIDKLLDQFGNINKSL